VVFYHAYSFGAIIYEVQAGLARLMDGHPIDSPPLPRLLRKPFVAIPDKDRLLKRFPSMPSRDHAPEFRNVAISASLSLDGAGSEAPPLSNFQNGYSCSDLSFLQVLKDLLSTCGLDAASAQRLTSDLVKLGQTYGLSGAYFTDAGNAPVAESPANRGHLLQIFVRKDIADRYCYISQPYGVPVPLKPNLVDFLSGQSGSKITGQARIVMHPEVFCDPIQTRIYHYCSNPQFMSYDRSMEGSRAAFIEELMQLLRAAFPTPAAVERMRAGVCCPELPREAEPPAAAVTPAAAAAVKPKPAAKATAAAGKEKMKSTAKPAAKPAAAAATRGRGTSGRGGKGRGKGQE
jgi:hypothetical protein